MTRNPEKLLQELLTVVATKEVNALLAREIAATKISAELAKKLHFAAMSTGMGDRLIYLPGDPCQEHPELFSDRSFSETFKNDPDDANKIAEYGKQKFEATYGISLEDFRNLMGGVDIYFNVTPNHYRSHDYTMRFKDVALSNCRLREIAGLETDPSKASMKAAQDYYRTGMSAAAADYEPRLQKAQETILGNYSAAMQERGSRIIAESKANELEERLKNRQNKNDGNGR